MKISKHDQTAKHRSCILLALHAALLCDFWCHALTTTRQCISRRMEHAELQNSWKYVHSSYIHFSSLYEVRDLMMHFKAL
jgi:hypothetical protein